MNNYNSIGSYSHPTVKYGVRQHVTPRRINQFSIKVTEWKQIGKIIIWVLPVLLIVNIMCSSAISSMNHSVIKMAESNVLLESKNIELLAEKAVTESKMTVKQLAKEKLGLVEVVKGQVGLFNRQNGTFEYR